MNRIGYFALFSSFLTVGLAIITFWPADADARMGGGRSIGSRGFRSFSTPRQSIPSRRPMRQSTPAQTAAPHTPRTTSSGMGAGLMGGLGGLALGGLLGATLFGDGGGGVAGAASTTGTASTAGGVGGSGIGLLEILLIGGLIWFAMHWFRRQKERASTPMDMSGNSARERMPEALLGKPMFNPSTGNLAGDSGDEVSQGLTNIARMDANFDEGRFLEGAKMAFQHIQGAWSDWSVERLRPLLTERMWHLIQAQAMERKAEGKRDIIEKIQFKQVEISEAWQESGEDWLTVHFLVDMVDYTTDLQGNVLEGNPNVSSLVEEYWTFNRPVGSQDPSWFLSAIQQPGEVARSVV